MSAPRPITPLLFAAFLLAAAPGAITALVIAPPWVARWFVEFSRRPYSDVLREGTTRAEQVSLEYYAEARWHAYSTDHLRPEGWLDPLVALSRWHWGFPRSGTTASVLSSSLLIGGFCGGLVLAAAVCLILRSLRSVQPPVRISHRPVRRAVGLLIAHSIRPWFISSLAMALVVGAALFIVVHFLPAGRSSPPVQHATLGTIIAAYLLLPISLARSWRRLRSRVLLDDLACCERCLYPRRGLTTGVCPECGATPSDRNTPNAPSPLPWRVPLIVSIAALIGAATFLQSWRSFHFATRCRAAWYGEPLPVGAPNGQLIIPYDRTVLITLEQPGHGPERWCFRPVSLGRLTHRITTFPDAVLLVAFPAEADSERTDAATASSARPDHDPPCPAGHLVSAAHLDTGGTLDRKFRWLYSRALVSFADDSWWVLVELRGDFKVTDLQVFDRPSSPSDPLARAVHELPLGAIEHGQDATYSTPVPLGPIAPPAGE